LITLRESITLLQEVPRAYNTHINDALLTALTQAFCGWTGEARLLVDLEAHGREQIVEGLDLSRTVGWFTSIFPVFLTAKAAGVPGNALKSIKEQLRSIPNRGIGYGLLRYMSAASERLAGLPQAEVSFNYLGQFEQETRETSAFRRSKESTGPSQSSKGMRRYLVTVNGQVMEDQLKMNWNYSENLHRYETIDSLARSFVAALQSLIHHCRTSSSGGFTPSDFPKAKLSQNDLNKVLARLGKLSGGGKN
jgi:non-ribosomal peptide synthase protein (TIGR01720 family)